MVERFSKVFLGLLLLAAFGCADKNFIEKNKNDGSVLMGNSVGDSDPLAEQVVMLAKNFESKQSGEEGKFKISYFGICSAVVVHKQYLLTAAHCVDSFENSRVLFKYNISQTSVSEDRIYRITKIFKHKRYDELLKLSVKGTLSVGVSSEINYYDIAVVKLDRPLPLKSAAAQFVDSAYSQKVDSQIQATATGFGRNTDMLNVLYEDDDSVGYAKRSFINGYLQKAHLGIESSQIENTIIVVDQRDKPGVCKGDSGGALFVSTVTGARLKAIAINVLKDIAGDAVNLRNECYGHSYFLNVDYYKKWINSVITKE